MRLLTPRPAGDRTGRRVPQSGTAADERSFLLVTLLPDGDGFHRVPRGSVPGGSVRVAGSGQWQGGSAQVAAGSPSAVDTDPVRRQRTPARSLGAAYRRQ
ncbi:hypothetical protein [Streptomyces sp. NPDC058671]|uniref:hypothetical protein n=1 Tax=Streptomyces sp. NPDC058671 TaxID=3346590 RepID=UPI00364A29FA